MTCYVDPQNGDVYDHEGTLVGNLVESHDWDRSWSGDFPREALDVLFEARENGRSAYNQELLFQIAAEQIEMGTPPE